jgi:hypothetical protein
MATSFEVRQFYQIPSEYGTFTAPLRTFVVTGSISRLLVNNGRETALSNDSMSITTQFSSPYVANSGTSQGWWPGASTDSVLYGIIVGGNDGYANPSPDGRTSTVSVWGWDAQVSQEQNDIEFVNLVNYILGTDWTPEGEGLGNAKQSLINAGFYYQYPVGFNGQSPNTGDGSDVIG